MAASACATLINCLLLARFKAADLFCDFADELKPHVIVPKFLFTVVRRGIVYCEEHLPLLNVFFVAFALLTERHRQDTVGEKLFAVLVLEHVCQNRPRDFLLRLKIR